MERRSAEHHPPQPAVPGATPRLLDVLTSPWAIVPEKLLEIQAVYFTHLRGDKIDLAGFEARYAASAQAASPTSPPSRAYDVVDGVAIIPIQGIIAKKMNLFTRISGGVSTQLLMRDIRTALNDPEVTSLFLNVDSPGGTVDGTEELANAVTEARAVKPVVAYTDGMIASAAYWIASAADMIYISGETPIVGSVGVVTAHVDYSGYEASIGVKTTEVYAGKYKRIASEYAPLSEEGRQYLQDQVDYLYSIFVTTVAANRPEKLALPKEGAIPWADGRMFTGNQALQAGLVDGVDTMDRLIGAMARNAAGMIRRERVAAIVRTTNHQRRLAHETHAR